MKILNKTHIIISIVLILVLAGSSFSIAQIKADSSSATDFIKAINSESTPEHKEHFTYIKNIIGDEEMKSTISKYQKSYPHPQAYTMFKNALSRIYMEGKANNFSEAQVKALFASEVDLETRKPLATPNPSEAPKEKPTSPNFPFQVYLNGNVLQLNDIILNNNKTYIGLREFCEKTGMQVEWVNPNHHYLPIPGGNLPGGLNIMNPSFVYTKDITNYANTDEKIKGVNITGIYSKYKQGGNFKYYFDDKGLVINDGQEKKTLKLNYNPSNQYMYVSVDEFREKIQPYFIDICMQ